MMKKRLEEDHRPWGNDQVLADEPDHKVKRIVIYPGKRLSLQRHHHRAEHWHVISGKAVVTRNEEEVPIEKGQAVNITQGKLHRIMNPGKDDMTFIEIKTGDYLGEDGIERIEDDFGRI